jgi:3,4-dihydroxy-2-butanone 4-phosphate synthase
MDKRKLETIEKLIREKSGKSDFPPPGFFRVGDPLIDTYREVLLRQGYTLDQVNLTPIFIEE